MIKFEEYDYYIKPGCTDLRKGALKLSLIVQDEIELNPFIKSIFMFCSKNRKTIYLRQLSIIDFIRNNIVIDFVLLIKSNYYLCYRQYMIFSSYKRK